MRSFSGRVPGLRSEQLFEVADRVVRIAFDADFLAEPIVANYPRSYRVLWRASLATFRAVAAYASANVPRARGAHEFASSWALQDNQNADTFSVASQPEETPCGRTTRLASVLF